MAIEAASLQAADNPKSLSVLQLNPTSITTAVEAMMMAFPDGIYHFQETEKDRAQTIALLKRLRRNGFQCSASHSTVKHEGLSTGVLTAVRKITDAQLPCGDSDGLTADPRCIWPRARLKGWTQILLMCNVYFQCGTGVKDTNLDFLRAIFEASDGG